MTALATSEGVRTPSISATPPARFLGPCTQQESSCTTPSAFGRPPYPTLSSSGSSSTMLTPAMSASSTSEPPVIIANAVSRQVFVPPFLNLLPLLEEMTTGLTLFGVIIVGACANNVPGTAAAAAAAAPVV